MAKDNHFSWSSVPKAPRRSSAGPHLEHLEACSSEGKPGSWYRPSDWIDILQFAADSSSLEGSTRYAYRGQENRGWDLVPRLHRHSRAHLSNDKLKDVDGLILNEFQKNARSYLPEHLLAASIKSLRGRLKLWSVMQHYGAPSPLLDWTRSPFVALYFACHGAFEVDGALWFTVTADRHSARRKCIKDARFNSARLAAQKGVFSYFDMKKDAYDPTKETHGERLLKRDGLGLDDSDPVLGCLVIPKELKTKCMVELRAMTISAASLFPGLEGYCASLVELSNIFLLPEDRETVPETKRFFEFPGTNSY